MDYYFGAPYFQNILAGISTCKRIIKCFGRNAIALLWLKGCSAGSLHMLFEGPEVSKITSKQAFPNNVGTNSFSALSVHIRWKPWSPNGSHWKYDKNTKCWRPNFLNISNTSCSTTLHYTIIHSYVLRHVDSMHHLSKQCHTSSYTLWEYVNILYSYGQNHIVSASSSTSYKLNSIPLCPVP